MWSCGEPSQQDKLTPLPPPVDAGDFRDQLLQTARRIIARIEADIEWHERLSREMASLFGGESAVTNTQQFTQKLRRELHKWKRLERELSWWALQCKLKPGREMEEKASAQLRQLQEELWPFPSVAPMPREKK
jgi:hypothetical protein